jgi:hypothetical protein
MTTSATRRSVAVIIAQASAIAPARLFANEQTSRTALA